MEKTSFFTKDKTFYKTLFSMLAFVALQNIIAYSVNMADNIMLGSYSQASLSGAATVNQVFFIVQQFALSFGNALVALAAQYWGAKKVEPIKKLTGITLKIGVAVGIVLVVISACIPSGLVRIFTNEADIISEGTKYLLLIMWTFLLYIITNILMAALRAVGTVNISFYISIVSLIVNVGINYVLIFGKLGLPEMGIVGAAIGTLVARVLELLIVIFYLIFKDKKLCLFKQSQEELEGADQIKAKLSFAWLFGNDKLLWKDYIKVYIPIMCASVLWGVSVPMQTAILGHMSPDAIAANSVATTFYQYLKVIVVAMSSTSAVMIGQSIGRGEMGQIKSDGRTLSIIDVGIGLVLGIALVLLKDPLLTLYNLNDNATELAGRLILIMAVIMAGMSYQMPVSFGIIQGGGDAKFTMAMNLISTWLIVMPLSFMAAFWWKWPVEWVVVVVQSDQIFKCLPTFIHFRKYKWMKKLTR
ncbi:MAG: MATE family efflux transporter [Lachnospiraceae bacterium]|nr:MATE family efflux transporter [Lachnospiraceae bacterium]